MINKQKDKNNFDLKTHTIFCYISINTYISINKFIYTNIYISKYIDNDILKNIYK